MPAPALSDELAQEAVAALAKHGRKYLAADALGLDRRTFDSRLKVAALRGLMLDHPPAMPGFRISQVTDSPNGKFIQQKPEHGAAFEMLPGQVVKGESALLDSDGNIIIKWVKTKEGELDPLAVAELIKQAFVDYVPAAPVTPSPAAPLADLLTLIPLADWHIGMFSWHRETGQNWDLDIAEKTIGDAAADLISRTPSSGRAIVLGGGDLIHSDNNENQTSKSKNVLQVDGRYDKTIMVACRLVERTVALSLQRHEHVTLRVLKGNHDKHASVAVAYHLLGLYRNEPRVTVDVDPSLYWWMRFGRVLLGATHGDEVKIIKMPEIMAHRRAEDWGLTKFRYVHGFHLHHSAKFATEGGGVISEVHQAPIPQDAWHYGAGFLSGRSLQAITYHREFGEIGRVRTAILDADPAGKI
jgi:hypothetical protein